MAAFVIDASVVVEYLIIGPNTRYAKALFDRLTITDRLFVPEFCLLECTNVIWKQVRFNGMNYADAEFLLGDLRTLKLRRSQMKRLLAAALNIAVKHNLAVYDAAYIALAHHHKLPLISIDQPQIRAAQLEQVALIPITHFKPSDTPLP